MHGNGLTGGDAGVPPHVEPAVDSAPDSYGYAVHVPDGYDEAVIRSRLALRREGFSIVTEMHVGDLLLPEKSDQRQYLIMGAWSSGVTSSPADDLQVAVHLSCNVVVHEQDDGAVVAALDPVDDVDPDDVRAIAAAHGARDALGRALRSIGSPEAEDG